MSQFAGMSEAKVFSNGSYFTDTGEYDCNIKAVISKKTHKNGPSVIVELEILKSSNPDKVPVGSKKSWVQKLSDTTIAFPNLLSFLGAVMGYDQNTAEDAKYINEVLVKKSEALLDEAVSDKNPLAGKRIKVSAFPHTTKALKEITRVRFSPLK